LKKLWLATVSKNFDPKSSFRKYRWRAHVYVWSEPRSNVKIVITSRSKTCEILSPGLWLVTEDVSCPGCSKPALYSQIYYTWFWPNAAKTIIHFLKIKRNLENKRFKFPCVYYSDDVEKLSLCPIWSSVALHFVKIQYTFFQKSNGAHIVRSKWMCLLEVTQWNLKMCWKVACL
jgi:hypothetical protein